MKLLHNHAVVPHSRVKALAAQGAHEKLLPPDQFTRRSRDGELLPLQALWKYLFQKWHSSDSCP